LFHKPKLSQLSIGSNMLSSDFGYSKTPNSQYASVLRDGQQKNNRQSRNKSQYKQPTGTNMQEEFYGATGPMFSHSNAGNRHQQRQPHSNLTYYNE
jgi:hypothetical protein